MYEDMIYGDTFNLALSRALFPLRPQGADFRSSIEFTWLTKMLSKLLKDCGMNVFGFVWFKIVEILRTMASWNRERVRFSSILKYEKKKNLEGNLFRFFFVSEFAAESLEIAQLPPNSANNYLWSSILLQ